MTTTTTRIRRTNTGSPFSPSNRPPLAKLPTELAKLLAELDNINGRLAEAVRIRGDYDTNWDEKTRDAHHADAQANSDAARHGKESNASTHIERLHADRDAARTTEAALTAARELVENDIHTAKDNARDDPKWANATAKTRANLTETAAKFLTAITAATEAVALQEWIEAGLPWDTNAAISAAELLPTLANDMAGSGIPATPAEQVITALTRIAG